jgi:vacuolar-type H+-ATPase subunit C/Vma6
VYHDLSEEEIINYTLPFGFRVRKGDIRQIASGGDMAEVVERVFPRLTDARTLLRDPRVGLRELEIRMQREIMKRCQTVFLGNPFHLGIPVAFLLLKEFEVQDLTVLIEGKAALMSGEVLEPHLVLGASSP